MLFNRLFGKVCQFCGARNDAKAEMCSNCGRSLVASSLFPDVDEQGRQGRWQEDTDHCPSCHLVYRDRADRYCRHCGRARNQEPGRFFILAPDFAEVIYGPMPVTYVYRCQDCDISWEGSNWRPAPFCPQCGRQCQEQEKEKIPEQRRDRLMEIAEREASEMREASRASEESENTDQPREQFILRTADGHQIEIPEEGCVVGRKSTGAEFFRHNSVSRVHARIEPQDGPFVLVTDMSTNGTYVAGKRLPKGEPFRVNVGRKIGFGEVVLTLDLIEIPPDPDFDEDLDEEINRNTSEHTYDHPDLI